MERNGKLESVPDPLEGPINLSSGNRAIARPIRLRQMDGKRKYSLVASLGSSHNILFCL